MMAFHIFLALYCVFLITQYVGFVKEGIKHWGWWILWVVGFACAVAGVGTNVYAILK